MKEKIDFAFVILTYRNTEDIIECIESIKNAAFGDYRIVIVDSYFNEITKNTIKEIAFANNARFLSVDNLGYSYGNNKGIAYCNEFFDYDFLVVCNPDIVVINNSYDYRLLKGKKALLAPCIYNKRGKKQNPYWSKKSNLFIWLMYIGYKYRIRIPLWAGILGNKVYRAIYNNKEHPFSNIYAAHGSFVLFTKELIDELKIIYDENVFLFTEEAILANRMGKNNFSTYYTDDIQIQHKEDGSMSLARIDEMSELRKSFLYYYENYEK